MIAQLFRVLPPTSYMDPFSEGLKKLLICDSVKNARSIRVGDGQLRYASDEINSCLVGCQATEDRLPKQSRYTMLDIFARALLHV